MLLLNISAYIIITMPCGDVYEENNRSMYVLVWHRHGGADIYTVMLFKCMLYFDIYYFGLLFVLQLNNRLEGYCARLT